MSTQIAMYDREILMGMLDQECLGQTGKSAAVIGAHKVGKTYLLAHICGRSYKSQEYLFCKVDPYLLRASCHKGEKLSDPVFLRFFLSTLLKQISEWVESQSADKDRWEAAIKEAEAYIADSKMSGDDVLYAEQSSTVKALRGQLEELDRLRGVIAEIGELTERTEPLQIYEVVSVIDDLESMRKRIILIIDEFNQLVKEAGFSDDLFSFLRGASNQGKIVALVTSPIDLMDPSLHSSSDNPNERVSLFNHFQTKILYPFNAEEADGFLDWLPKKELQLSPEEKSYLQQLGGGSPFFLEEAWRYFKAYGRPADAAARQTFERKYLGPALENPFRQVWERCSAEARSVLRQVAVGEQANEVSQTFNFLETAGYLLRDGARASLFSTLFAEFVKRQSTTAAPAAPVASRPAGESDLWVLDNGVTAKVEIPYAVIPSSLYYISPEDADLVTFRIKNETTENKQIVLTCELPGYSPAPASQTVIVAPGEAAYTLKVTLDDDRVGNLRRPVPCPVPYGAMLIGGEQKQALPGTGLVRLLPKNNFLMARYSYEQKKLLDFTWLITAWVNEDEESFNIIRQKASQLDPSFGDTVPEGDEGVGLIRGKAAALYQALQEQEIKYHNHTLVFHKAENDFVQRVRLPQEVLKFKVANCLEGAVLFASLLVLSDLDPAILLVPGHAVVGWKDRKGSGYEWDFLETTIISEANFNEALEKGQEVYDKVRHLCDESLTERAIIDDPENFAVLHDIRKVWQHRKVIINP